ncbi:hypothetical protein LTR94_033311, partial [Friedmanniomyces endolithicus]
RAGGCVARPRRHLPERRLHPVQGHYPRGGQVRDGGQGRRRRHAGHHRLDPGHRPVQDGRVEGRRGQEAERRRRRPAEEGQGQGHQGLGRLLGRQDLHGEDRRRRHPHHRRTRHPGHGVRAGRTALPALRRRRDLVHRGPEPAGSAEEACG